MGIDERAKQKKLAKKKSKRKKAVSLQQKYVRAMKEDFESVEEPLKMSEVLMEFIEPLAEVDKSDENRRKSLAIGVIAWNLALAPETKRKKLLEETLVDLFKLNKSSKEEMQTVFKFLIDRKERYFGHINRFIVEYNVTGSGDSLHLSVISTLA